MPFSIGWAELFIVAVVALIVIGPKDLPIAFRKFGQFVGRLRAMGRDFQYAMDQAAEQSGVNDLRADFEKATSIANSDFGDLEKDLLDPIGDTPKPAKTKTKPKAKAAAKAKAAPRKAASKKTKKTAVEKTK